MSIEMICSDIDGTLLDKHRAISPETVKAVQAIRDRIPFLLVSSRMPSSMELLQDDLGTGRLPMVCYNGGLVLQYDAQGRPEVLHSEGIAAQVSSAIARACSQEDLHVSLYHNNEWFVPGMDAWALREENNTRVSPLIEDPIKVTQSWKAAGKDAHKVMIMGEEEKVDRVYSFLEAQFAGDIHLYRSRPTYIEIASKRISKASGIEKIMAKTGPANLSGVMSFGDNYNDIDMLEQSGLGIAVENAKAEVLAIADEITLSNKMHGVAVALHKHFGLSD